MNVPENELVYIDSVNENKTKCAMKNSTDSNFKNVEMPNGSLISNCSTDKLKNVPLPFYVVNAKSKPILGLRGYNAVPVIHPPRRVPLALQPKLKSTLDILEKEGIVSKVNKLSDWVQSLVIVEKPNGYLILCLDPRDLNNEIKREHYQIPCTDDIICRLEGRKIFSVVDLKDGFWHVPLDEVSSEICAFNTPFGRYKFNKMPFGIVSAPEPWLSRLSRLPWLPMVSTIPRHLEKAEVIASFRIIIGHDFLGIYLHWHSLDADEACLLGMDGEQQLQCMGLGEYLTFNVISQY
ncbi:transposon Ty3-I Gag-Pol polyprotein [Trichonephila clavipes]|nr:transposon Ty3-I Gag-Pol polyprotein [Trichonephila clavipes]